MLGLLLKQPVCFFRPCRCDGRCWCHCSDLCLKSGCRRGPGCRAARRRVPRLYRAADFGLAPVINTLVSLVWHPKPGKPWHFGIEHLPGWKLILGIVLVGLGAFLVLYSKERSEVPAAVAKPVAVSVASPESPAVTEEYSGRFDWLAYVLVAGLAWGTYVPIVFYGGQELTGKPGELGGRLMSILCVGMAYFLLAVLVPSGLMSSGITPWPASITGSGLFFSGMAGVAGAVGAICVIFASKSAVDSAKAAGLPPASFRVYIAPLIFGVAPVINTLVSLLWHPKRVETFCTLVLSICLIRFCGLV